MRTWFIGLVGLGVASASHASTMQLVQQGRVLDASGAPVTGTHTLEIRLVDGGDTVHYGESYPSYPLTNGYFTVHLGAGSTPLPSSVFLDHGAIDIEVLVDGQSMSRTAAGGYPFVVAQQSLLAREETAQQIRVDSALQHGQMLAELDSLDAACGAMPTYSEDCIDWAAAGWGSERACLTDGRWHRYATTNGTWDDASRFVDFWEASKNGADTKVRLGLDWYEVVVRHSDDSTGPYMFTTDKGAQHLSFRLTWSGDMNSVHATTGSTNASFSDNWWNNDNNLGNRHHFMHTYSHRSSGTDINENRDGGISVWARY